MCPKCRPPLHEALLSSSLPAMPTFTFWKTLSLALLTFQTVTGDSNFLNIDSSLLINPPNESGLVRSPIADGSNNEPLPDSNWLLASEKDFCASPSNQMQVPRRRRSRLKREETTCASELNGNTQSLPQGQQPALNEDQTGSTPTKDTTADPGKSRSRWLDLPNDPALCGRDTGLAQIPVCHPGYPRVESVAWWLENIRPCK